MANVNAKIAASRVLPPQTALVGGGALTEMWKVFNAEVVAGTTNTVRSILPFTNLGFLLNEFRNFGLYVVLAGATPSVTIQLIQSWDDVEADYVVPAVSGTIVTSLTSTAAQIYGIQPTPLPYLRLQAVGTGANGSDTTLTAYLWMQG